jgi:hypothetical protein
MTVARMTKEIIAVVPARVGLLADVTEAIKVAGVNITAVSAYERDGQGKFLLVTDDNDAASKALARLNADVREKDVVVVELPDRPGALEEVARKVAEAGINIEYTFGTVGPGGVARVVLKTSDDLGVVGLF